MNTRNVKIFSGCFSVRAYLIYRKKRIRKRYVKILYIGLVGFSGCKQIRTNIKKRLKHIDGDGVKRQRKEFGANIQILRKKKF